MRGQAFKGNPGSLSLWQPFVTPRHPQAEGIPLGYELRTGKIVMFYPWTLPTHSTTFQIEGEKNSGKSTFMKVILPRLLCLQAADAYGNRTKMRGRINSRKSEQGVAEFAPLADALATPIYDIAAEGAINLFGLFSQEADIVELAIDIVEEVSGQKPAPHVAIALMVAVQSIMASKHVVITPELLEIRLRSLTIVNFQHYHDNTRANLYEDYRELLGAQPSLASDLGLLETAREERRDYIAAAQMAADCFSQLIRGNYGGAFGGKNSLYDVLSEQVVALNWENLPDNAQTILEAVLMKAEASAIVQSKRMIGGERDLSRIIPHINLSDEEGGEMKSVMHARATANRQNKSRAYPTAEFRAVQYYSQVTKAGSAGSELRSLAEEIENGVGCRIIFRQPNDVDFLQRFSRLGMSDTDVAILPHLQTGQAMLWLRDHPPLVFQTVLTPSELPLVQSNSARSAMSASFPMWEPAELRRQMATEGTVSLPQ